MRQGSSRPGRFWGWIFVGALVPLFGSAPSSSLSGRITSLDPRAGRLELAPLAGAHSRPVSLRYGRETVVDRQGRDGTAGLAAGQLVKVAFDPDGDVVRKVTVVVEAATPHATPPENGLVVHSASKPPNLAASGVLTRADANRAYGLSVTTARTIDAVLAYELVFPKAQAAEWIVVAPVAPELPGQRDVRTSLSPAASRTWDMGPGQRPLLTTRLPVAVGDRSNTVSAHLQFRATLLARGLYRRPPGSPAVDAIPLGVEERRKALAHGGAYDLDAPEFRRWLSAEGLTLRPNESEIDFARRVFLAIKKGLSYEYRETMDRRASQVCAARRSDCGGLSVLFAAALRTQAIPARILVGRWARSAEPGDRLGGVEYHQWHVKAEFYADGVGWIPVDLAAALLYDRSSEGLVYFGNDAGDFLTWHVDPDLVIDSIHFGPQPTPLLNGGLAVWVVGRGSLAGQRIKQDWQVRDVEASARFGSDRMAGRIR